MTLLAPFMAVAGILIAAWAARVCLSSALELPARMTTIHRIDAAPHGQTEGRPADPSTRAGRPRIRVTRRRTALGRDLPLLAEGIARELRAGAPMAAAVFTAGRQVGGLVGDEVAAAERRVAAGIGLSEALRSWSDRVADSDLRMLVGMLGVSGRLGGGLADSLDAAAEGLVERRELAAEARAMASQARASATLLVVAPIGFAFVVAAVDTRSLEFLLGTPLGLACLGAAALLDGAGAWWMHRITAAVR